MNCLKCNKPRSKTDKECQYCGVLFSKIRSPPNPIPSETKKRQAIANESSKLIKCTACGKEISKNAPACPHCGEPKTKVTPPSPRPKVRRRLSGVEKFGGGFILFCIVTPLIAMMFGAERSDPSYSAGFIKPPETIEQLQRRWVEPVAQGIVKNNLKSPSTADFPWDAKTQVVKLADNNWSIRGVVDSQNGFSATIRSSYALILTADPTCADYAKYSCWEIKTGPGISSR